MNLQSDVNCLDFSWFPVALLLFLWDFSQTQWIKIPLLNLRGRVLLDVFRDYSNESNISTFHLCAFPYFWCENMCVHMKKGQRKHTFTWVKSASGAAKLNKKLLLHTRNLLHFNEDWYSCGFHGWCLDLLLWGESLISRLKRTGAPAAPQQDGCQGPVRRLILSSQCDK